MPRPAMNRISVATMGWMPQHDHLVGIGDDLFELGGDDE
jgi:hypothetical protein